jgi:hypothetical protein
MLQLLLLPISLLILFKVFAPVGDPLAKASVTIRYGIAGFSAILAGISFSAASAMNSPSETDLRAGYLMAGEAFLMGSLSAVLASIFKFFLEALIDIARLREMSSQMTLWLLPILLVGTLYYLCDFICSAVSLLSCHGGIHCLVKTILRISD